MSLRLKLALSSTLVLAVSLGLVTAVSLATMSDQFEKQQAARVAHLRPLLNAALAVPVLQRDYASVQAILEESLEDPALIRLAYHDVSDRLVASAQRSPAPESDLANQAWPEFQTPLQLSGQSLGSVRFTLSREDLNLAQTRVTYYVLGAGTLVLFSFSGLLWLVSGSVTRRLSLLVDASRSMAQGRLTQKLPPASNDEVGQLIQAFSAMGTEIQRKVEELRSLNEALEQKVSERTQDLTQRTHELDHSVRALQTQTYLLNHAPFATLVLDTRSPQLTITDATAAVLDMFGYTEAALVGQPADVIETIDSPGLIHRQVQAAISGSRPLEWEMEVMCQGGETRWCRCLAFALRNQAPAEPRLALCLVDIQELWLAREGQRRLTGELQEKNKLQSVGLAIAGIAHDLNTPVGVALTASTLLRSIVNSMLHRSSEQNGPQTVPLDRLRKLHQASDLIAGNLARAGALVAGLKTTTANAMRMEKRTVALLPYFEELLVTLSPITQRERCTVRLTCPSDLTIYTEPGSLGQVITNLVVNATIHAFEDTGSREISIEIGRKDQKIEIRVSDNGSGMGAEALTRAFTPFYTTRRDLGGSGLGLFSSRRVVEEVLLGSIAVHSSRGVGTSFLIKLPLTEAFTSAGAAHNT